MSHPPPSGIIGQHNSTEDGCLERTWFNNELLGDEVDLCETNSTEDDFNTFYFYQTEQLAFLWILLILIIVGNMAVLLALGMSTARKSRMNYFIKHLAIADLCVGVISVLTDIVWKITVAWHAGNIACKVIRFSQVLVTYSSTYVLVALSIDRYDAICHPMNFSRGWRRARLLIIAAWVVSAVFSTPMLVLYEEGLVQGQVQCWIDLPSAWQWQLYLTLVAVSLLVLPALLIFACYIVIVRTIWVQSAALMTATTAPPHHSRAHTGRGGIGAAMLDEDQESRRASSRGIIPRAKIKTVKMTFVIVFVFILCWAPYIVFDLLQVYGYIPKSKTMIAVATFIQSLAPLNSAANPLIYCLFSTHLCRNLRKIPALEWMAGKLENVVHSIGLCPEWSCCAQDGDRPSASSPDHISVGGTHHHHHPHPAHLQGTANSKLEFTSNRTRNHHLNRHHHSPHNGGQSPNNRQVAFNQQYHRGGPFHRLGSSLTTSTNLTNTTTTSASSSSTPAVAAAAASAKVAVEDEAILQASTIRSEWV